MMDTQVPQLVELPFACDCEHDEIVYWHTVDEGKAEGVRLYKGVEVIHFDMWIPTKLFKRPWMGSNKEVTETDAERAFLKAYQQMTTRQRNAGKPVEHHVVVQGHPQGMHVTLEKSVYHYEQPVWRDSAGRIW